MESHVANANIFNGITLAAIGFETYLFWKAIYSPGAGSADLRLPSTDKLKLKPIFAHQKVGLNLKVTW